MSFATFAKSALLAAALLISGCATPPPAPTEVALDASELSTWEVEGKLGYRSPAKNGSAWISWEQRNSAYVMRLSGPFGAAATRIEGDEEYTILSQSGQEDIRAGSAAALTWELFGWPLPVAEMGYWIRALPAPDSPGNIEYDENGVPASLTQAGWSLTFSRFQRKGAWLLPGKISGHNGEYAFTLIINDWAVRPVDETGAP